MVPLLAKKSHFTLMVKWPPPKRHCYPKDRGNQYPVANGTKIVHKRIMFYRPSNLQMGLCLVFPVLHGHQTIIECSYPGVLKVSKIRKDCPDDDNEYQYIIIIKTSDIKSLDH